MVGSGCHFYGGFPGLDFSIAWVAAKSGRERGNAERADGGKLLGWKELVERGDFVFWLLPGEGGETQSTGICVFTQIPAPSNENCPPILTVRFDCGTLDPCAKKPGRAQCAMPFCGPGGTVKFT